MPKTITIKINPTKLENEKEKKILVATIEKYLLQGKEFKLNKYLAPKEDEEEIESSEDEQEKNKPREYEVDVDLSGNGVNTKYVVQLKYSIANLTGKQNELKQTGQKKLNSDNTAHKEESKIQCIVLGENLETGNFSKAKNTTIIELGKLNHNDKHYCITEKTENVQMTARIGKNYSIRKKSISENAKKALNHFYPESFLYQRNNNNKVKPYLIMPFLGDNLTNAAPTWKKTEEILGYMLQILSLTQELHQLGLVHLDIKPKNFLLKKGKISLIDFDGAWENQKVITHIYESPKFCDSLLLLKGRARRASFKNDIFSLGRTIEELVVSNKMPNGEAKTMLTQLASVMADTNFDNRPSLEWSIKVLGAIYRSVQKDLTSKSTTNKPWEQYLPDSAKKGAENDESLLKELSELFLKKELLKKLEKEKEQERQLIKLEKRLSPYNKNTLPEKSITLSKKMIKKTLFKSLSMLLKKDTTITKIQILECDFLKPKRFESLSSKENPIIQPLEIEISDSPKIFKIRAINYLCKMLRYSNIKAIKFTNNEINDKNQTSVISNILSTQKNITNVNLSNNDLFDNDEANYLVDTLLQKESITELNLSFNPMYKNDIDYFVKNFKKNQNLQSLNLSHNKLGKIGKLDNLFKALKNHPTITKIDLSGNKIEDKYMDSLFNVLKTNPNITELKIDATEPTLKKLKFFLNRNKIKKNKTLKEFPLINKTIDPTKIKDEEERKILATVIDTYMVELGKNKLLKGELVHPYRVLVDINGVTTCYSVELTHSIIANETEQNSYNSDCSDCDDYSYKKAGSNKYLVFGKLLSKNEYPSITKKQSAAAIELVKEDEKNTIKITPNTEKEIVITKTEGKNTKEIIEFLNKAASNRPNTSYFAKGKKHYLSGPQQKTNSLEQLLKQESWKSMSFKQCFGYMQAILKQVRSLHKENLVYAKLSPKCILISDDYISFTSISDALKIGEQKKITTQNTPLENQKYIDPNITKNTKFKASSKNDVFSLGKIFSKMVAANNGREKMNNNQQQSFDELIKNMTNDKPEERPTIKHVKKELNCILTMQPKTCVEEKDSNLLSNEEQPKNTGMNLQ